MYKKYCYETISGTEALCIALKELNSKKVIIPSYTCTDILRAVTNTNCEYYIVDCGLDLQIDVKSVLKIADEYDTIIIPHMFGIRADVKSIKKKTSLKIIEDLSQCHGLPNLGQYADIVVSSLNKSKWIDRNGGGLVFSDNSISCLPIHDFNIWLPMIQSKYKRRVELANEIQNAGIKLIGKESSWLRGMYKTLKSNREPYIPLHKIVGKFDCPKVNSYINKIDWISIIV